MGVLLVIRRLGNGQLPLQALDFLLGDLQHLQLGFGRVAQGGKWVVKAIDVEGLFWVHGSLSTALPSTMC